MSQYSSGLQRHRWTLGLGAAGRRHLSRLRTCPNLGATLNPLVLLNELPFSRPHSAKTRKLGLPILTSRAAERGLRNAFRFGPGEVDMTSDIDWKMLRHKATEAAPHAYAPYSGFSVGAAALVDDHRMVAGCNVENVSYGLGLCAECAVVCALHSGGGGRLIALSCVDAAGRRVDAVRALPAGADGARRPGPADRPSAGTAAAERAASRRVRTAGPGPPRRPAHEETP